MKTKTTDTTPPIIEHQAPAAPSKARKLSSKFTIILFVALGIAGLCAVPERAYILFGKLLDKVPDASGQPSRELAAEDTSAQAGFSLSKLQSETETRPESSLPAPTNSPPEPNNMRKPKSAPKSKAGKEAQAPGTASKTNSAQNATPEKALKPAQKTKSGAEEKPGIVIKPKGDAKPARATKAKEDTKGKESRARTNHVAKPKPETKGDKPSSS